MKVSYTLLLVFCLLAVQYGESAVTIPTNEADSTRPFVQGVYGEMARAYMNWTTANEIDLVLAPNPIVELFSSYVYAPTGLIYKTYFNDGVVGEIETKGEYGVRYHQLPTSAGINTVFAENFESRTDWTKCAKHNPYRPAGMTRAKIHRDTRKFIEDNYGPTERQGWFTCLFNSNCNRGCDWLPVTYYLATRGDGAMMEARVVPSDGKTDYDVEEWLTANAPVGGIVRWRVEVILIGAALGLAEDILVTNVKFHEFGEVHYEVSLVNPELLAILSGGAQKRSTEQFDVPKILAALPEVLANPEAYKARFPEFTTGIDWLVSEADKQH